MHEALRLSSVRSQKRRKRIPAICATQSKIQNAVTSKKKEKLKEVCNNHIKNWQVRNQMNNELKKAKDHNEKMECLIFDLEKTLLPRLASVLQETNLAVQLWPSLWHNQQRSFLHLG